MSSVLSLTKPYMRFVLGLQMSMREKANYPVKKNKKKIDLFLAFQRNAKSRFACSTTYLASLHKIRSYQIRKILFLCHNWKLRNILLENRNFIASYRRYVA